MENIYRRAALLIKNARKIVAFSGAGISAESGIHTFRDPGGIWEKFDPDEVGTTSGLLNTFLRKPNIIKEFLLQAVETFERAEPNSAHIGLKEMEDLGLVSTVITQNIDNLHREAGSSNVIEVHGNLFRARCLNCGAKQPVKKEEILNKTKKILASEEFDLINLMSIFPPCQRCKGVTRPDVVMFGEPVQQLAEAFSEAGDCDLMLVVGTSGVVYPAAQIPYEAYQTGAKVIEINPTENIYSSITEIYIKEKAGLAMAQLVEELRKL